MSLDSSIERVRILVRQSRHAEAEREIRRYLASHPEDGRAHSLLALCLIHDRNRLPEANSEAGRGVHFAPDDFYTHYVLALVLFRRNLLSQALQAADEAVALEPCSALIHGIRGEILNSLGRHSDALVASDAGLGHDPEDQTCSAVRSIALERLGKVADARAEAEHSIRRNPDSSEAHAARGWALLNSGQHRAACESFREALRLEPANEFARQGMIRAINCGNPLFRLFFHVMMWMSRQDWRLRWGLMIAFVVMQQVLSSIAGRNEQLRPWVLPLAITMLLLALLSWIINPLFNTVLRFHPFGRHLLNSRERLRSNVIAGTLLTGLAAGVSAFLLHGPLICLMIGLLPALFLTVPICVAFNCEVFWARSIAIVAASGFGLMYLAICMLLLFGYFSERLFGAFVLGCSVYSLAGIFLQSRSGVDQPD